MGGLAVDTTEEGGADGADPTRIPPPPLAPVLPASLAPLAALAALRNKKTYEGQLDRLTGTRMTLETQVSPARRTRRPSPPSSPTRISTSRLTHHNLALFADERARVCQHEPADDGGHEARIGSTQGNPRKDVRPACPRLLGAELPPRPVSLTVLLTPFDRALATLSCSTRNIDKVDATMDSVREQMELTNEISEAISHPAGLTNDADEVSLRPLLISHFGYLSTFISPVLTRLVVCAHPPSHRRISRRSSRRSSRSSSTTVFSAQSAHPYTRQDELELAHARVSPSPSCRD